MALNLFNKPVAPTAPTTPTTPEPSADEAAAPAVLDTTASEESDRTAPAPKEAKEDGFEKAIRTYLEAFGKMQPAFAEKYRSSSKTIRQCCDYIINEARKNFMLSSGKCAAMSDEETYGLAVHFFEEDSIKPVTNPTPAKVVTPQTAPSSTPSKPTTKPTPSNPAPKKTKPTSPQAAVKPQPKPTPKPTSKPKSDAPIDLFDFAAQNGIDLF